MASAIDRKRCLKAGMDYKERRKGKTTQLLHYYQPWIYYIITSHGFTTLLPAMDLLHYYQPWIYYIITSHGFTTLLSAMDLLHYYQPWIYYNNLIERWLFNTQKSDDSSGNIARGGYILLLLYYIIIIF